MTINEQRRELQSTIWKIADDVRGAVEGWDFKQYILGTLFYRFISEHFTDHIEAGDSNIDYASFKDDDEGIELIKDDTIKVKGFFIYPSQLFCNVLLKAKTNERLNTDLQKIFKAIEDSASGYDSEESIKGLFRDFDTTSARLGNTVTEKNDRLYKVLSGIRELNFNRNNGKNTIDLFGEAYEFLIHKYASTAGKSGGEFFTPQQTSKLLAKLAMHDQKEVNKIYDPACGSGSLLLQGRESFEKNVLKGGFYGQELNPTTYNLARMNMFLHNINYDKFNIKLGSTLINPAFADDKPFDAIVSNPPYSIPWVGSDDPTLINDPRFAPASVLAPKSKADYGFILHSLYYLSASGRAAIVCFPGIFYRTGAEQKIRKYLIDNGHVEAVISLPSNLFYGTSIAVSIMVLGKKHLKTVRFIDVSGKEYYKKITNANDITDEHIQKIIDIFASKDDMQHIAKNVSHEEIERNDYNLSVGTYVEPKDTSEKIDIETVENNLKKCKEKTNTLRSEIDSILSEIQ